MAEQGEITRLFEAAAAGDESAYEQVVAKVYQEMVVMARAKMHLRFGRLDGLTLEPTALVNETLLKLFPEPPQFANRRHFFAFASKVMQRALIDYERSRNREKRGGGQLRITLTGLADEIAVEPDASASSVSRALTQLEELDGRKGELVQLKIFWGLETREIADLLDVSVSTVERDWRFSRSWLAHRLTGHVE